jgi:hypothetical protein
MNGFTKNSGSEKAEQSDDWRLNCRCSSDRILHLIQFSSVSQYSTAADEALSNLNQGRRQLTYTVIFGEG